MPKRLQVEVSGFCFRFYMEYTFHTVVLIFSTRGSTLGILVWRKSFLQLFFVSPKMLRSYITTFRFDSRVWIKLADLSQRTLWKLRSAAFGAAKVWLGGLDQDREKLKRERKQRARHHNTRFFIILHSTVVCMSSSLIEILKRRPFSSERKTK